MNNRYSNYQQGIVNRELINQPTIHTSGANLSTKGPTPAPYFAITVNTSTLTAPAQAVVFDASQGFQLDNSYTMPLGMVIAGTTNNYQFILNDIAHTTADVDIIKITVSDPVKAAAQFGRPINVYECIRGSKPSLVKTLHPQMGLNETQFQSNIVTFDAQLLITNRTALVFDVEPGVILTIGFYQQAEIGRKN